MTRQPTRGSPRRSPRRAAWRAGSPSCTRSADPMGRRHRPGPPTPGAQHQRLDLRDQHCMGADGRHRREIPCPQAVASALTRMMTSRAVAAFPHRRADLVTRACLGVRRDRVLQVEDQRIRRAGSSLWSARAHWSRACRARCGGGGHERTSSGTPLIGGRKGPIERQALASNKAGCGPVPDRGAPGKDRYSGGSTVDRMA